jgi:hypothetical protein
MNNQPLLSQLAGLAERNRLLAQTNDRLLDEITRLTLDLRRTEDALQARIAATANKEERLVAANKLLELIGQHGRHFFRHGDETSHFVLKDGKTYLCDAKTKRTIAIIKNKRWPGFSEGYTLQSLIVNVSYYILHGDQLTNDLGPWPDYIANGDLWGYSPYAMIIIRREARRLGILSQALTPEATA